MVNAVDCIIDKTSLFNLFLHMCSTAGDLENLNIFFLKQQKIEQGPGGKWSSKGGSRSPQFGEKRGKNVLALIL